MSAVRHLTTQLVEKVWGRDVLPTPFGAHLAAKPGARIGEMWFDPPPELSQILVKYLFTSEKLSVQVHPSDAAALPGEAGKEECWLVLDAEPGASLAIGFQRRCGIEEIRAAALDGAIVQMLRWHPARTGDLFYLPAGTVHAIGAGLTLVELQQNSDTTFRLYDYGRPRELHLERALAVLNPNPYDPHHHSTAAKRGEVLVDSPHFRLARITGPPGEAARAAFPAALLALPLTGEVSALTGDVRAGPGECLYVPGIENLDFSAAELTLLACASS